MRLYQMHDKAPFLNYHFALVLIIHAYIRRPPICQYKKKEIFTLYISVKQSTIEKAREKAVFQSTFFRLQFTFSYRKWETFRGRKFEEKIN